MFSLSEILKRAAHAVSSPAAPPAPVAKPATLELTHAQLLSKGLRPGSGMLHNTYR